MAKSKKKKVENPINLENVSFQIKESYKAARTNIAYSIVKTGCKKVAFTSSVQGEGKTVTAVNVATALAMQIDTKVLVIDCDLRRPRVHSALEIGSEPGIANYLNNECSAKEIIRPTKVPNLFAVCFGVIPPNPSELLASKAMMDFVSEIEKDYDYIIFDTPPIGVVMDAMPMFKISDGVVMVVRHNSTTKPAFNRSVHILNQAEIKIIGVIMNGVEPVGSRKYGKNGYSYGYYRQD